MNNYEERMARIENEQLLARRDRALLTWKMERLENKIKELRKKIMEDKIVK